MTAVTAQSVRHRHRRPPLPRRVHTAVSRRIPSPVNTLWDAAEKRPLLTVAVVFAAAGGVAAFIRPGFVTAGIFGYLMLLVGAAMRRSTITDLRNERDSLLREAGAKDLELRKLRAGSATASTQQIHAIGDLGERS